jgi:hypothetical protein
MGSPLRGMCDPGVDPGPDKTSIADKFVGFIKLM